MKKIATLLFLAFSTTAIAQPTISSVSPLVGIPGSTVTISGTNFNTTPANDVVYFGATRATVTAASATSLSVTVPAGATFAPVSVENTAIHLSAFSKSSFLPTYNNTSYGMDHVDFDPAVIFGSGTGTPGVNIGDIDGDGKPDIVVVSGDDHTVSVLRNIASTGTLTSGSFDAPVTFAIGSGPDLFAGAAIADIDGDGKLDIVVVNTADSTISVLHNTSSPGSLSMAPQVIFATGHSSYPRGIVVGDIDGDGKPDMACVNSGNNTMSVFHNISVPGSITTGSFETPVIFPTGNYPNTMAIGDLDGDGKPELVTANDLDENISVFRNTATSGTINTGSLAAALTFSVTSAEGVVIISDMDGDGKQDIIVAGTGYGDLSISVLRNTSAGSITFAPRVVIPAGATPWQIGIGDINGDGKPDLAVINYDDYKFSTFINASSPGAVVFARVDFVTSPDASGLAIGDLDGDGKPDLIIDTGALIIYHNHPDTSLAPVITSISPEIAYPGTTVTITGTNFNSNPANDIVYFGATRATVTFSSSTTLSVTVPTGATYSPVSVDNTAVSRTGYSGHEFVPNYNNTGYAPGRVNFDPGVHFASTWDAYTMPVITDIDGDGKPDVVTLGGGATSIISVFRNTATAGSLSLSSLATTDTFPVDNNAVKLVVGDIDGDGKPDIIGVSYAPTNTVSILRNTSTPGSVSFAPLLTLSLGDLNHCEDLALGDLDGDGRLDIVVPSDGTLFGVFQNESTPGTLAFAAISEIELPTYLAGLAIGDIDGDGKADLVIPANGYDAVTVWHNIYYGGAITAGSFDAPVNFSTDYGPEFVCIADFDGDGKLDLAVQTDLGTTSVLRNTSSTGSISSSSFAPQVSLPTSCYSPFMREIEIADVDGDGKPDIVNGNAGLAVFRNSATSGSITSGSFARQEITYGADGTYYAWGMAVGDLDGDGKPDIAVGGNDGALTLFRNDPLGPAPVITSVNPVVANTGAAVTITGNYFNTTAANNIVYFGATRATVTAASSTSLSVTVPVGATYDYVTVNNDSSLMAYSPYFFLPKYNNSAYLPNTVHFDPQVVFGTDDSPNGVSIADMDGDGKPDIVVANQFGLISVYLNTATSGSITAGSFAAPVDFDPAGYGVQLAAIGDIDGDGKPDIAFTTSSTGQVSVLRNTSSVGSLSFSTSQILWYATGQVGGIVVGDINGDGKPDIAVSNSGNDMISVYPNVSAPGNISFGSPVTFATGTAPWEIALADIDGDGKKDIIVPNFLDNTISVFRNINAPGAYIDTNSFSARVDFPVGTNPVFVTVGDLDGDGKTDVVVLNSDNTASVFHNTASSGVINASSLTSSPALALRNGTATIQIGDIDGDGRGDLAAVNEVDNTASVFRNTSAPGTISFAPDTTFVIGLGATPMGYGGSRSIAVGDLDGDGKADIVASNLGDNTISILRNHPLSASSITGTATICVGANSALTDLTPGGTWSSGSPSIATVGSTGIVHGVAPGTAVISYTTGSVATIVVTINPLPNPGTITGSPLICIAGTDETTLSDAVAGGTWTTASPNVTIDGSGNATGVVLGTATISYTVSNGCGSASATYIVTVTAGAAPGPIAGNPHICSGGTASLSDAVAGGVWSSGATGIATVGSTGVVTGIGIGTATISYTISGGCGGTATMVVTVSAASAGTITGLTQTCIGSTTALTDAVTGGTWTSGSTGIATIGVTGIVTGIALGTATISYTVGGACGGTATTIVTVSAGITAGTISGTSWVCAGYATSLTDPVIGGGWSSSNTLVATVSSTGGIVIGLAPGTATIYYSVSNSCGTATASRVVTVNPAVSAGTITGTAVLCSTGTTHLSDLVAGGVWSSVSPLVATVASTGIVSGVSAGTSIISYTVTNSCGTSAAATRVVTVNAAPGAGTISGAATVCGGATITLTDAVSGGTWSSGAPAVATVGATGIVTGVSLGTATISYTVTNSCGTATATANVTVTGSSAGTITGPSTVITGTSISLTDAASGGTWSASNGNATVSATGLVTGVTPGTVTISYTVTSGCGSLTTTKIITVSNASSVSPISGYFFYMCTGATAAFWDVTTGGTWSISPASVATVSPTGTATGISAGTATLSYTYGGSTVTAVVTVYATPAAIAGASVICSGTTTVLSDATPGGTWSSSAGSIASISTAGLVTGATTGTTTIYYTGAAGCKASMVLTVTSAPSGIGGATSVCAGSGITLSDFTAGGTWSSSGSASVSSTGSTTALVTGITPGAATITYSLGASCYRTFNLSVKAVPTPILGNLSVCGIASVTFLSDVTSGISWTVSPVTVATVSPSGRIYGVSAGTANVTYTGTNACIATAVVTVNAAPVVAAITGPNNVSHGATINLSDITGGGAWSSSNSAIASVDVSGVVTGVATSGIATITYAVGYGGGACNAIATKAITVHTPSPHTHTATTTVGAVVIMTDEVTGGDWFSSDDNIATVDASGVVTALAVGNVMITHVAKDGTTATQLLVNALPFEFRMIPNPNKGTFTISGNIGSGKDGNISIEIANMLGQVVYSSNSTAANGIINEQVLLNSNLANGMYLLNVKSGSEGKTVHFVIEK